MDTTKNYSLGNDWYANLTVSGSGEETLTIRNPEKGQRINLPDESVKLLREIFQRADLLSKSAA